MHIVQIYHSKVPVKLYGGMERVVESLSLGLLELGHRVTLISFKGYREIKGVNHLYLDLFKSKEESLLRWHELIPKDADILHSHLAIDFSLCKIPNLMTLHGHIADQNEIALLPKNTIFLSGKHAKNHFREHFVFNGLKFPDFPLDSNKKRKNLAFLGRAKLKRKGLKQAKILAKELKLPLYIGGKRGLSIGKNKYLGHLNDEEKFKFLSNSFALLFPITWEEPFGLVMIEAMYSGAHVFALSRGSVPEVLGQPGSEGLFVMSESFEDLVRLSKDFKFDMSPLKLREYCVRHFSHLKMAENYLIQYQNILNFGSLK